MDRRHNDDARYSLVEGPFLWRRYLLVERGLPESRCISGCSCDAEAEQVADAAGRYFRASAIDSRQRSKNSATSASEGGTRTLPSDTPEGRFHSSIGCSTTIPVAGSNLAEVAGDQEVIEMGDHARFARPSRLGSPQPALLRKEVVAVGVAHCPDRPGQRLGEVEHDRARAGDVAVRDPRCGLRKGRTGRSAPARNHRPPARRHGRRRQARHWRQRHRRACSGILPMCRNPSRIPKFRHAIFSTRRT